MSKIAFVGATIVMLAVIGIDAWLSARTITPSGLADSLSNRLSVTTTAKAHYGDYLLPSD